MVCPLNPSTTYYNNDILVPKWQYNFIYVSFFVGIDPHSINVDEVIVTESCETWNDVALE